MKKQNGKYRNGPEAFYVSASLHLYEYCLSPRQN
jgi:hypothetical protein